MDGSENFLLHPGFYYCCSLGISLDNLRFGILWLSFLKLLSEVCLGSQEGVLPTGYLPWEMEVKEAIGVIFRNNTM